MLLTYAALTLTVLTAQQQQTDTTITVNAGTRLELSNPGGDVIVRAWSRNAVQIKARHSARTHVQIESRGAVLSIDAEAKNGPANIVDYDISVPAWMPLSLDGMYSDMTIEGSLADIKAETLNGTITVKGGTGTLELHSVQGQITVEGSHGRLDLHGVSEGIKVSDAEGDVSAETISGNVVLTGIRSRDVEVGTLSGNILYDGTIQDGGRYSFVSHNGDLYLAVPEAASATFNIATLDGEVSASFALPKVDQPSRRRKTFRLGAGSATVDIESFNGNVSLGRPGQMSLPPGDEDDNQ